MRILQVALVVVSLSGCKQGEGERCQVTDDCESGLICSQTGRCQRSGTETAATTTAATTTAATTTAATTAATTGTTGAFAFRSLEFLEEDEGAALEQEEPTAEEGELMLLNGDDPGYDQLEGR